MQNQYSVHCKTVAELTPTEWNKWAELQASEPDLVSPYFHPGFTQAVAEVRNDVRVGVVETSGTPVAFFPHQKGRLGIGKPVGGRLSDYHGLIAASDFEIHPSQLLGGCGLQSWEFNHLPAAQRTFAGDIVSTGDCHQLNMSHGFEAYAQQKAAEKSGAIKEILVKYRRLERNIGPVSVEIDCRDETLFNTLLAWKSAQYAATGYTDVFSFDWTVALLKQIWKQRDTEFCGLLSVLRAENEVLAIHFGMRSRGMLHWWFPVYSNEFHKYSPGNVLLYETAREMALQGVTGMDLGKGDEPYKVGVANHSVRLAEGISARASIVSRAGGTLKQLKGWLKTAPVAAPVRSSARMLRPLREKWSFE